MKQSAAEKLAGIVDKDAVILLDIDGTLNEAQQPISEEMHKKLQSLARQRQVYFVTGNNYIKSVDIINGHQAMYGGVFCNNADELRSMRGKLIWQDTETAPLPTHLENQLMAMLVSLGGHYCNRVEWRSPRMVNFCEIGRFAPLRARHDHDASWREAAAQLLRDKFPDIEVCIGGAVSIDVHSKGADKSRACKYFNERGKKIVYIGDKMDVHGNDYSVKKYCDEHNENICLKTDGVSNTLELLDGILRSY